MGVCCCFFPHLVEGLRWCYGLLVGLRAMAMVVVLLEIPLRSHDRWKLLLKAAINQFWKGLKAVLVVLLMILLMMSTVTAEVQTVGQAEEARDTAMNYEFLASIAEMCFVEQEEERLALIEVKEAIGVSVH